MEAENFLASGFGTRISIESKSSGWGRMSEKARTWQPSRLKGIQVGADFGTPFLAATQVFDVRPVPRKWLSLNRTADHAERFVKNGTILVTCSGSVGRATLAHSSLDGILVSHDLLRIDAIDPSWRGWIYAYLRTPSIRAMMMAAQYGHIIKHLETHHLDALPLIEPSNTATLDDCNDSFDHIVACRNSAREKMTEAEDAFRGNFGSAVGTQDEAGFVRRASDCLFSNRRRFDAWSHNPQKTEVEDELRNGAAAWTSLREANCDVWLPNRFKRNRPI